MAFNDDGGGFRFACDDAKFCLGASTWNTRLSQLGKMTGEMCILTRLLPNLSYIERILGKRPHSITVIAHKDARDAASQLKQKFPGIRVLLNSDNNAKVVLIEPETVWLSSGDFGESSDVEAAVGFHSSTLYGRVRASLFQPALEKAVELR